MPVTAFAFADRELQPMSRDDHSAAFPQIPRFGQRGARSASRSCVSHQLPVPYGEIASANGWPLAGAEGGRMTLRNERYGVRLPDRIRKL